jgi:iron complex outermembrane receptor protein
VNYPGLEVAVFSQVLIPALGQSWRKLNAEQADQFEAGVRHALNDRSSLSLTVFSNRVRDRYVIVFPPPPPPRYSNLGNYRTEGLELTADAAWSENLAVFAAASLVRTTPGDIPYAPETTLTTGVNWQPAKHWHVSTDAVYVSSMHIASEARVAATTNPLKVGANFLLNARLSRRFTWGARAAHRGEVYLSAENLTDRAFAYQPGYPIPGLNFMIGVRLER